MKLLPLSNGMSAFVDDEDYERLSCFKWHYTAGYAYRHITKPDGKQSTITLHREVMNNPSGMEVDHRFGNKLDCRKQNLRACSHAGNMRNRRKKCSSASRFKGVSWHAPYQKWRARITFDRREKSLGYFATEEAAAAAYNAAAVERFGEFACLNEL